MVFEKVGDQRVACSVQTDQKKRRCQALRERGEQRRTSPRIGRSLTRRKKNRAARLVHPGSSRQEEIWDWLEYFGGLGWCVLRELEATVASRVFFDRRGLQKTEARIATGSSSK
jgi:hypothetical protein